jgi:hypothetical protein
MGTVMIRSLRSILAFVSANASTIIAVASVCIASLSLYFTIDAQRAERAHKELLLRPSLGVNVDATVYSVVLVNNGLGPAYIKNVAYHLNNECLPFTDGAHAFAANNYSRANQHIVAVFGKLVDDAFFPKAEFKNTPSASVSLPVPSHILGVGQDIIIYRMGSEFAKELVPRLWAVGSNVLTTFNDRFLATAITLPMSVEYCSMSGQYCEVRGDGPVPCRSRN